jgi:hypothetical protein
LLPGSWSSMAWSAIPCGSTRGFPVPLSISEQDEMRLGMDTTCNKPILIPYKEEDTGHESFSVYFVNQFCHVSGGWIGRTLECR